MSGPIKDGGPSDRDLLELAAKACGYDTSHPANRKSMSLNPPVYALWIRGNGGLVHTGWNPLDEDASALRLMVGLNLVLKECCNSEECYPQGYGSKKEIEFFVAQDDRASQMAAARRAIVRAAAAIGAKS